MARGALQSLEILQLTFQRRNRKSCYLKTKKERQQGACGIYEPCVVLDYHSRSHNFIVHWLIHNEGYSHMSTDRALKVEQEWQNNRGVEGSNAKQVLYLKK